MKNQKIETIHNFYTLRTCNKETLCLTKENAIKITEHNMPTSPPAPLKWIKAVIVRGKGKNLYFLACQNGRERSAISLVMQTYN